MSSARLKKSPDCSSDHQPQRAPAAEGLDLLALVVALVDAKLPDLVAGPLVDGQRDVDALAVGREHHARRADLHAEIAAVVIHRAQHEDVALEDVLPVRPARPEGEEAPVAGLHRVAELGVGDVLVADERDAPHRHRLVLGDLELDDDLVLALRLDRVLDVGEEVALLRVGVLDLLHAAAHGRHAEDRVGLELDGLVQLLVVELVVPLVGDLLDVGPLADDEPQDDALVVRGEIDLDVLEEAGVPQGVHVPRQVLHLEEVPRLLPQVGEDVLAPHAPVADDLEAADGEALGLLGHGGGEANRGLRRGRGLRGMGRGVARSGVPRGCRGTGIACGGGSPRVACGMAGGPQGLEARRDVDAPRGHRRRHPPPAPGRR